ncbi:hypothetical protein RHECNPAF_1340029 [Rhizobium etli CNPAF512]|nr:hypothetical protein RHECNPAF_1340029 [Rhizobium etli CNPAF512]
MARRPRRAPARSNVRATLSHVAQKCAAVLRQRHAQKQRTKARRANLEDRNAL